MKWTIRQLLKHRQGGMHVDGTADLSAVKQLNPEIREISPVRVTGTCSVGSGSMTCHFRLEGTMTLPESRTWEDIEYPFEIETDEQFVWEGETDPSDDAVHEVTGEVVDPTPVFEELVLLEVPIQIFSEEAARSMEGKGWTFSSEEEYTAKREEEKPKVDPRLAGLADLFGQSDDEPEDE
ncbi:YceD family protein [Bhargavaea cecembensis]|uniref:YceD family protein n=1 Tax=Bhargavaea cecembensis TaxID=394098 RepID=UPI00058B223D|nr:YceD family protein [Bhargavaea cecembensis]